MTKVINTHEQEIIIRLMSDCKWRKAYILARPQKSFL